MAARSGVEIHGLRETIRSLERFGVSATDLKAAFTKVGGLVVHKAESLAPRQTGALVGTIKASKTKNKSVIRAGSARVPYAGVIHYGGYHGIEPHPYLTDAAEQTQPEVLRALDSELRGLIRQYDLS